MPAHMVNAYYSPDSNTIVFPAAILQAPFYSLEQSASQNYGGIGAVIAHEISHAFDNNGAQFDKYGNLNKWWTDEDYEAFEKKQEEMIAAFDGRATEAGPANGKLIVSENIADQGGITAAMTAAQKKRMLILQISLANGENLAYESQHGIPANASFNGCSCPSEVARQYSTDKLRRILSDF